MNYTPTEMCATKTSKNVFLLATLSTLLLAACQDRKFQTRWWQGEEERLLLQNEVQAKSFRISDELTQKFADHQALEKLIAQTANRLATLRTHRDGMHQNLADLKAEMESYRQIAIRNQRERAMKQTYAELTLKSGRQFKDVSITSITDVGVGIRHADGSARMRFSDLTESQRAFFALDGELAAAAEQQEAQTALAYERWIDEQTAILQVAQLEADKKRIAAAELKAKNAAQYLAANASSRNQNMMASASSLRFGRRFGSSPTYRVSSPSYRYVNYYQPTECYPSRLKRICSKMSSTERNSPCNIVRKKPKSLINEGN